MLVIRESQMAALGRDLLDQFAFKALAHVKECFPELCEEIGESTTLDYVRDGLTRARVYGLESEYDLFRFLNLVFTLGSDFDSSEEYPWVAPILKNMDAPATTRMDLLMDEVFTRVLPSENESSDSAAMAGQKDLPFDGIVWEEDEDTDYVPKSITPQVRPFQLAPFPDVAPVNPTTEGTE
jgi:hypothetical protein